MPFARPSRSLVILAAVVCTTSAVAEVDPSSQLQAATASVGAAPISDSAHPPSGSVYEINDLRLRVGFLPDHVDAGGHGGNWDNNFSIGVLAMRAPHPLTQAGGLIWGCEGSINTASRDQSGDRTSYVGFMTDIMVGYAYRLPQLPNLHFEGTPFLGIGVDHFQDDAGGSPTAFTYEYGLRAAGYWTFPNLWQAGLDLRLMETKAHPDFGGPVGSVTVTTDGVAVLFTGGRRF